MIPVIMSVIVIMTVAAIYVFQVVFLQYVSLSTVERAAFIWDDADRQIITGQLRSEEQYGLYENEIMLQLVSKIIPIDNSQRTTSLDIISDSNSESDESNTSPLTTLISDKLVLAQQHIEHMNLNVNGQISYSHPALLPRIEVTLKQQLSPLTWRKQQVFASPAYTTHRSLVNPISFIRSVDLIMYYTEKLKKMTSSEQSEWKQNGGKAIKSFSS
ncbi:hypothetical protein [Paenibacillus endoradicis]|uniref:hypothetical protein n=1 Tax=Paenibacillus endoradicis TaxID=2972487 RepID=UPI002158FFA4|nr:hypothetical protein [Paenibacillus endoradicis]